MATIQIRDIPDDVHRTYRRRAADAGMSLQEYLLAELVEGARTKTPAELVGEIERHMRAVDGEGFTDASSVPFIRADRDSR
jgi:antitoxin FitA